MKSMVVFFALVAAACGSLVPWAQPAHLPAVVLDPHGRPLDTAEVINARAIHYQAKALEGHYAPLAHSVVAPAVLAAPAVVAAPSAVSHQSRVDVISSPAVVSHSIAAPYVSHGWAGHGHLLKKRSLAHVAVHAPIVAPSAVSHQSRVDVISRPAVVSHAVAAPIVAHAAPIVAHAAPVVAVAPSAVSHQSRVDVRTSPAVVSHNVVAAPYAHGLVTPYAHGVVAPYGHGVVSPYASGLVAPNGYGYSNPLVHAW